MAKSPARILIVDDQAAMRRTVRRMLMDLGYANIEENDGRTVLEMLKEERFDLVICDWQMEPHSGLEVLQFVRADRHLKGLPFIMLTGETTADAVAAAASTGASDYIAKPFSRQTLATRVERLLPGADAPRQAAAGGPRQ
jgi:two-component system chemotaxis response regulator CheY